MTPPPMPSARPQDNAGTSALGSLLQCLGVLCYRADSIAKGNDAPFLESALALLPHWEGLLQQAGLATEYHHLAKGLRALGKDAVFQQEVIREFNDLFQHPVRSSNVWESVWRSKEKTLFTEETTAVREWYRRYNWEIKQYGYEAEDHIALELAFAGWLYDCTIVQPLHQANGVAASQGKSDAIGDSAFAGFFMQHLGLWGKDCLQELLPMTHNDFWVAILETVIYLLETIRAEITVVQD